MGVPTQAPVALDCALLNRKAECACALAGPAREWPPTAAPDLFEIIEDAGNAGHERPLPSAVAEGCHVLLLQLEGRCVVQLGEARTLLEVDDLLLLDTSIAARFQVFGRSRQLCLALPRPSSRQVRSDRYLPFGSIRGASGIGVALRSLLLATRTIAGSLTPRELHGLRAAALDLALVSLAASGAGRDEVRQRQTRAMRPLADVQATIERSLADPGLSPARVAEAHGISTRQLQRLFKQAGTSFSAFVRQRRLERCRGDLADPHLRRLPMTEIAYRWGFSDSSHFSRCFRAAFGCTARDFRAGRDKQHGDSQGAA